VGAVSSGLIDLINTPGPLIIVLVIVGIAIAALFQVRRNEHVRGLLLQGWSPLFGAMAISSGTGIVLDVFVSRYQGFALLAIVISGELLF
jgi:solute carrier family 41